MNWWFGFFDVTNKLQDAYLIYHNKTTVTVSRDILYSLYVVWICIEEFEFEPMKNKDIHIRLQIYSEPIFFSVFPDCKTNREKTAGNRVTRRGNGTSENGKWTETRRTSLRSISTRKWSQSHCGHEKVQFNLDQMKHSELKLRIWFGNCNCGENKTFLHSIESDESKIKKILQENDRKANAAMKRYSQIVNDSKDRHSEP